MGRNDRALLELQMLGQVEVPLIQQLFKLYRLSVPRSHGMDGIHRLYELGEDGR